MLNKLKRYGKFKTKLDYTFRYPKLRFAFRIYFYDKVAHSYKVTEFSNVHDKFKKTRRVTKEEYTQG